jgi:undecaprenyl-diphosphatase
MPLYVATDWLSLIPIGFVVGFAVFGVVQLIKRKSILKVDREILLLGAFYLTVAAVYVIFEVIIINYRPILIDGQLEASYPSSTTVLVLCVMLTAAIQLNCRIKNKVMRSVVLCGIVSFVAFMIICRIASGVHWITDIIGGMLISAGLLTIYYSVKKEYKI